MNENRRQISVLRRNERAHISRRSGALILFLALGISTLASCNLPPGSPPLTESQLEDTPALFQPTSLPTPSREKILLPPTVDEFLAECPSAEDVHAIDSRIKISFESDPSAPQLKCKVADGSVDLTRMQKNLYNAILLMKKLKFDAPLPWTDLPLYEWFTTTISGIRVRAGIAAPTCCGTPPTIQLKDNMTFLYSDRWTAVGRVMEILVHEARHTYRAHGCSGKDFLVSDLGSYGVEYYLITWLAYHSDPHFLTSLSPGTEDDYRQAARFEAYTMLKNIFCNEPTPEALPSLLPGLTPGDVFFTTEKIERAAASGLPAPVLISPAPDEILNEGTAVFSWEKIASSETITYNIEVDALFQFGREWSHWKALLDESGLTETVYSMSRPFDYYDRAGRWRVWATGSVSGDGPKSEWRYVQIPQK